MCRPYVCAQTILVCLIENEKGIKLKGLEFTETKLRVSRRHKIYELKRDQSTKMHGRVAAAALAVHVAFP